MSGTFAGGIKARDTNLKNNPDFYSRIGAMGGKKGHTGGFYGNSEAARIAGAKGGRKSKRGPKLTLNEAVATYTGEIPKQSLFSRIKEVLHV